MTDEVQIAQTEKRIAALEREIEQGRERLKTLQAKSAELRRRAETRTKIIYGAALLTLLESMDADDQGVLRRAVEKHVTRKADRVFLGLEAETHPARIIAAAGMPQVGSEPTGNLPFPV